MLWLLQNLNSFPKKFPEVQWAALTEAPVMPCYPAFRDLPPPMGLYFLPPHGQPLWCCWICWTSRRGLCACRGNWIIFLHICMLVLLSSVKNIFYLRKKELIKIGFFALEMSATASHHPMKSPLVSLLSCSWTSNSPIIPLTLEGQRYIKSIILCVKAH